MWEAFDITLNFGTVMIAISTLKPINFAIYGALPFLSHVRMSILPYRICLLLGVSTIKLLHQKSQIVPVIPTAQCNLSLELLMRLYGSTVSRVG